MRRLRQGRVGHGATDQEGDVRGWRVAVKPDQGAVRSVTGVIHMRWMVGLLVWAGAAAISATVPTGARSDVNYRWASEFHHGITYDSIRSADGAELTLYCGAANMGESGLMFDAKG